MELQNQPSAHNPYSHQQDFESDENVEFPENASKVSGAETNKLSVTTIHHKPDPYQHKQPVPLIGFEESKEGFSSQNRHDPSVEEQDYVPRVRKVPSAVSNLFYHRSVPDLPESEEDVTKVPSEATSSAIVLQGPSHAVSAHKQHSLDAVQTNQSNLEDSSAYSLNGQPSAVRSLWSSTQVQHSSSVHVQPSLQSSETNAQRNLPRTAVSYTHEDDMETSSTDIRKELQSGKSHHGIETVVDLPQKFSTRKEYSRGQDGQKKTSTPLQRNPPPVPSKRTIHESFPPPSTVKENTRRHIDQELQPRIEVVPSHQMLHASKPQIHLESSPPNAVLGGDSPNFIVRGIPSHNLLHKTASVTHLEKLPEEKSENTLQPPPVMRKAVSKNFAETFHTDSGLPSRDLQGNAHHIYRGPPVSYQNYDKIPVNEPLHKNLKSESIREEVVVKKPQEPKYRNVRSSLIDPTTAKRMILLSNGDKNQRGITYVLNEKKVRTWDTLLREWTDRVKPTFGPVRRVFTPQSGTEIREFGGLQGNAVYVVSGYEKLRPLPHGYKVDTAVIDSHFNHNFLKKRTTKKAFPEKALPVYLSGDSIPDRRLRIQAVLTINVHKNGDDINPPTKITLKKFDLWNITRAKDAIAERVKPLGGVVKSIYTVDGIAVEHVVDLHPNCYYVTVGPFEKFHSVNYEPTGRQDLFMPMSAKHPSVYQREAPARAEAGMRRRRTFVIRLKKKPVGNNDQQQLPERSDRNNKTVELTQNHEKVLFKPTKRRSVPNYEEVSNVEHHKEIDDAPIAAPDRVEYQHINTHLRNPLREGSYESTPSTRKGHEVDDGNTVLGAHSDRQDFKTEPGGPGVRADELHIGAVNGAVTREASGGSFLPHPKTANTSDKNSAMALNNAAEVTAADPIDPIPSKLDLKSAAVTKHLEIGQIYLRPSSAKLTASHTPVLSAKASDLGDGVAKSQVSFLSPHQSRVFPKVGHGSTRQVSSNTSLRSAKTKEREDDAHSTVSETALVNDGTVSDSSMKAPVASATTVSKLSIKPSTQSQRSQRLVEPVSDDAVLIPSNQELLADLPPQEKDVSATHLPVASRTSALSNMSSQNSNVAMPAEIPCNEMSSMAVHETDEYGDAPSDDLRQTSPMVDLKKLDVDPREDVADEKDLEIPSDLPAKAQDQKVVGLVNEHTELPKTAKRRRKSRCGCC